MDLMFRIVRIAAPPVLGALGAVFLMVWPEGFHAFCGGVVA